MHALEGELASILESLSEEERRAVMADLYEIVAAEKNHEAVAINSSGLDAQVEYLRRRYENEALVETILDTVDHVRNRGSGQ